MAEESPESASQGEAVEDQSEAAASSSTNFETLQERFDQEGRQATTEAALRELLRLLDPHPQDHALTYPQVLGRLETVIARERQQSGG